LSGSHRGNLATKLHTLLQDSEKVYVLKQTYRLVKATAAVVRDVAGQVCRMLPEGSVVVVESDGDAGRR
jgi:hypothetical protein